MARNYLILLFSLAFFVAGGLLRWESQRVDEVAMLEAAYVADLERSVAVHWEEVQLLVDVSRERVAEEPLMFRLQMAIPILLEVDAQCKLAKTRIEAPKSSAWDKTPPAKQFTRIAQDLLIVIKENEDYLAMSSEDIEELAEQLLLVVVNFESIENLRIHRGDRLNRLRAEQTLALGLRKVVNLIGNFFLYRGCGIDHYFPIVMADKASYSLGENGSVDIGIGSYSSGFNPEYVQILIDGVAYKPNEAGTVTLSVPTKQRGNNVLSVSCRITNPLTGKVMTGDNQFTYFVR